MNADTYQLLAELAQGEQTFEGLHDRLSTWGTARIDSALTAAWKSKLVDRGWEAVTGIVGRYWWKLTQQGEIAMRLAVEAA